MRILPLALSLLIASSLTTAGEAQYFGEKPGTAEYPVAVERDPVISAPTALKPEHALLIYPVQRG